MNRLALAVLTAIALTARAAPAISTAVQRSAVATTAREPAAQGELVAATYDLAPLAPRVHSAAFVDRLFPALNEFDDATTELENESLADSIAGWIGRALEPEFDAPGRELRIEAPSRLRVVAPRAVHAEVTRVLTFFESAFRRGVDVRFDFIESPADAPIRGGLIPQEDAERMLSGAARRSFSLRVPAGRVGLLDASEQTRFIGDYQVEVAESAAQHYPKVETLRSGVRCAVRAAAIPGGIQLALFTSDSAVRELRSRKLKLGALLAGDGAPEAHESEVEIEIPTLLTQGGGFNLFVPDGQALVFDAQLALSSGARRETLIVRCSPAGAPPSYSLDLASGARLELLDASWRLPPRAELVGDDSGFEYLGPLRGLEFHGNGSSIDVVLEPPTMTDLHERLAYGAYELTTVGPWILALHTKSDGPSTLDFGAHALAPGESPGAAQFEWTLRRARGAALASGAVAVSLGATSVWTVGAETRVVSHTDVEIASKTATLGAHTANAFDGLVIWARPTRALDGGIRCELAVESRILRGAAEERAVGAPLHSAVDRASWDVLRAQQTVLAPADGAGGAFVFHGGGGLELELRIR